MKKIITFGEIMMRLAPRGFLRFSQANNFDLVFGGAESNVAFSLANFGMDTEFVTRLPKNDFGKNALMEMRKYNLGTKYVLQGGDRLGIYFMERGIENRPMKVVYDRSNSAMSQIKPGMFNWKQIFKNSNWFHWSGITPAISRSAADVCLEAIKIARDMGLTISTDLNYRSKLWSYECDPQNIMTKLTSYSDIIVGNAEAIKVFFGLELDSNKSHTDKGFNGELFLSICKKIKTKFPSSNKVIITSRESISSSYHKWFSVLYDGSNLYQSKKYKFKNIVDRIGGGDAFMSGIIYGLINYPTDFQKVLSFASEACCFKHSISGDVNLASVSEIEKLLNSDYSGI
ncbi:MAG: 2-dehydro-3-deoxygluconokinase [Flavobacteriaceae bacterium]|nr:2-dehydro-3-deoxygluconokinase [Flavobacteriaceae bacterium]|tara:strand:- start:7838 stop:8866 length:1029 start_codon:yes stop_codon:yes gene_type:complete